MREFEGLGYGYQPRDAIACDPAQSRGRLYPQSESPTRTAFQRDRDRIIHSSAFRRLKHKTQVFISHEGDHFRTRLTHTIEVAQIARSIARAFRLDEDLAEAIALVHDFGHTPFGHAGERVLDALMADYGGFDHNAQSLRIVTKLERRYAEFDGLNLSWETLEGLVKHNGPLMGPRALAGHGVPQPVLDFDALFPLELATFASLEAQAAAIADDIAYDSHDIDDGLRAGILDFEALRDAPLVGAIIEEVERAYPGLERARMIAELGRRQITRMVEDVIAQTARALKELRPQSAQDVRTAGRAIITFSSGMREEERALKAYLFEKLYRHPVVRDKMDAAAGIVRELFGRYMSDNDALPESWRDNSANQDGAPHETKARRVSDFIAGMTDQFAMREYERLFDRKSEALV
ncbi:MAG: deoxyguanosinetriphosphate triphosphohydrolase [Rhizobiaceae bacterium]